jgi:dTDP-4-dehydrorhamnose 3,5-epimerase
VAIPWPIPLAEADVSEKDRSNPALGDVTPLPPRRTLVLGSRGQLGRAIREAFPDAMAVDHEDLDLTDPAAVEAWPWHAHDLVVNAAAFTAVDAAERPEGRRTAWAANAQAPAILARKARDHGLTLVHFSTDYVFDGSRAEHDEAEPVSPLGVYGQSKAAGDLAVATAPRHYLVRTSWVVGDGPNFVRTMRSLAADGASPSVVSDQVGRLTFASELARATRHLVETGAPYGTYHVTNAGPAMSWAEVAAKVFELSGRDPADVSPVTTAEYAAGKEVAPRPGNGTLSLAKIRSTGFEPEDGVAALARYLRDAQTSAVAPFET